MEKVVIEKLDNQGRGIAYINGKITFVLDALPKEEVLIQVTKEYKKYQEAKVVKYIKRSDSRIDSICPYFGKCSACELQNMSYEDTLLFKKDKIESLLYKYAKIRKKVDILPSKNRLFYRNKLTLKVSNYEYGYYLEKSHELLKIDTCYLIEPAIRDFMKDLKYLHIKSGEVVIRSNYNRELLIAIKSKDKVKPDISYLKSNHKIVGIVLNDKAIEGEDKFVEIINHQIFVVSYNSFFQVNRDICSMIFNLIKEEISEDDVILDLYCGVGTLGINASSKASKAYGIEIVKNAVLNAITNSKINRRDNIYYMLGEVKDCLPNIKDKIDTIIVDPPRTGLDKETKEYLKGFKAKKIIYVSCDPITLARDLKDLDVDYNLEKIVGLDMFAYTAHVECLSVLRLR